MKRTRLRRVSKTSSHPERDRELVEAYRAENPACEGFPMMCQRGRHDGSEIHHIAHSAGRRYDRLGNIIHLCADAHAFCHANPVEGTILCLASKRRKDEVIEEDFNVGSIKRLPGWLLANRPMMTEVVQLWRELVDRFVDEDGGELP